MAWHGTQCPLRLTNNRSLTRPQDLALYWLVYTEAANLRHTPEMMWFIFYCAQRSWQVKQVGARLHSHHCIRARCRHATDAVSAASHDDETAACSSTSTGTTVRQFRP